MTGLARWERVVVWAALGKVALGVGAYLIAVLVDAGGLPARTHLMAAHVIAYGVPGFVLLWAGSRDPRAVLWGIILVFVAEAFVDPTVDLGRAALPAGSLWFATVGFLQFSAFSAYFLWRFVRQFPRVSWFGLKAFTLKAFIGVAAALGAVLFVLNVVGHALWSPDQIAAMLEGTTPAGWLWAFMRENDDGAYWPMSYGISIPAAVALLAKLPAARREEKRRAWLLVTGYLVGTLPSTVWIMLTSFSAAAAALLPLRLAGWVIYPSLLAPPFITGYAVVVHRALDVRLVARNAFRYAMTRYALVALAVVPFVALSVSVIRSPDRSSTDLLSDQRGLAFIVLATAGLIAVRFRHRILDLVDGFFFKDVYQARRILRSLERQVRVAASPQELAGTIGDGLSRAFQPETSHVLLLSDAAGFAAPQGSHRPLSADSSIPDLLSARNGVLRVDLSLRGSKARELPEEDRFWLADGGVRLLVAMRDDDGRVVGLMALGYKNNELPYTVEDIGLLKSVSSKAAAALALVRSGAVAEPWARMELTDDPRFEMGRECPGCGTVEGEVGGRCAECGRELVDSPVPLLLANKFRVAERLGAGAMGVVYRALDLRAGESVAIKTLPRTTPGHAARLRNEARAMAAVSHPNLASILEGGSWRGVPMLVLEYLPGGTLADRIRQGPLPTHEVISIGVALADALRAIHRAGILHRDIKPSNIGFAEDGTPKLIDFGVARILGEARAQSGSSVDEIHGRSFSLIASEGQAELTMTRDRDMLGTPLYLSPEAVDGRPPDPHVDLWSLALTLYEAAAGVNPVMQRTMALTLLHILKQGVPGLREVAPAADPGLDRFFASALSLDRRERPRSAAEFGASLAALQLARAA